jgi:hypothetical protein
MVSISKTPNDDDPIIPNEIISKNERKKERKKEKKKERKKEVVGRCWIQKTSSWLFRVDRRNKVVGSYSSAVVFVFLKFLIHKE